MHTKALFDNKGYGTITIWYKRLCILFFLQDLCQPKRNPVKRDGKNYEKSRFEEDVTEDDVDYEKKESTPADLEEEGRAIRDFSEENEDQYFAEEIDDLEGEEE